MVYLIHAKISGWGLAHDILRDDSSAISFTRPFLRALLRVRYYVPDLNIDDDYVVARAYRVMTRETEAGRRRRGLSALCPVCNYERNCAQALLDSHYVQAKALPPGKQAPFHKL